MANDLGINTFVELQNTSDILAGLHETFEVSDIVIAEGQNLKRGACLGKQIIGVVNTIIPSAIVGTGNGVLTKASPATATGVKAGTYKVIFIEKAENSGDFIVEDPSGIIIGTGVVGTLFDGVIKFTIADGSTDFTAGSYFNITVTFTAGDGKYYLWDSNKTDGTEILTGILGSDVNASEEDGKGFMYVHGEFLKDALTAVQAVASGVYNNGAIVIKEEK